MSQGSIHLCVILLSTLVCLKNCQLPPQLFSQSLCLYWQSGLFSGIQLLQSLPSSSGSCTAVQVPSAPHVPLQHSASALHSSPPAMQVHTRRKLKLHPVPRVQRSDISRGVHRRALFASQVLTAP